jgi:RNA-directed DNA polymerase
MRKIEEGKTKSIPITELMVWDAYRKVKANRGSAGIDKISLEEFEADKLKQLYKIWNRLSSGSYFPPSVRAVEIPKKDGSKRKLGIPTVGDRVAQQVIKSYLEPRLEACFHCQSYGYRPLKSAHQAVAAVRENVRHYPWVVDIDISKFFDKMSHELLMKALDVHVEESWVKMYIQRWLDAPVKESNGQLTEKQGMGTPQGGVISPLLANLFLHYVLDKWLDKTYPRLSFVRYADDIVIHCFSEAEAKEVLEQVKARLENCKLSVNEKKTKLVYCQQYGRQKKDYPVKFDFLGFSFQPRMTRTSKGGLFLDFDCAISLASEKRIVETIRQSQFSRWSTATIEEIARIFNPRIRGWINYYGKFRKYNLYRIFRRFRFHLMKWVTCRYKNFRTSKRKAYHWIKEQKKQKPNLFYHWQVLKVI